VVSLILTRAGYGGHDRYCPVGEARRSGRPPVAAGGAAPDPVVLCPDLGVAWWELHDFRQDGGQWPSGGGGGLGGRWRRNDGLTAAFQLVAGALAVVGVGVVSVAAKLGGGGLGGVHCGSSSALL
jgi:hypothetical protein